MANYPSVYPSEVKYRSGRVQTLNPDQEILLKQAWAFLFHYWGYPIDLPLEDIESKKAFVASSVTKSSTPAAKDADDSKKRSLFRRKKLEPPVSAARRTQLARLKEVYEPVEVPEFTKHVYGTHYGETAELRQFGAQLAKLAQESGSDDAWGSDETSDASSLQTFYTAYSALSPQTSPDTAYAEETASTHKVSPRRNIMPFMTKYDPQELHHSFFAFPRNDLVDNLLLRFIRARKYVLSDSMKMLANSLHWKRKEYPVNEYLLAGDAPAYIAGDTLDVGFIKNFTVSKSFIRGEDRNKNPLFVFQSRKHFAADSPLPETEKFALVVIEWCRLFLREVNESVDTCSVMFDLSGFSMKNADNAPVKFLMSMFEAHYPECLGIVIVHNAPWIFLTVWSVIKNWLDPVVAGKIHFTKGYDDLVELIEPKHIPEYLGGKDTFDLSYKPPTEEHTKPPKAKDSTYYKLLEKRHDLYPRFLETTRRWVQSTSPEVSSQYLREKIYLSYELSDNYIALDPYIRNPGVHDRDGTLVLRN